MTLTPEKIEDRDAFVIKLSEGAPADLTVQAALEGGTSPSQTVRIVKGTSETTVEFTPNASTMTLTLSSPSSLPISSGGETGYKGLVIAVVETPLITNLGICHRTPEVQEALLEKIESITDCRDVTVSDLEGVSGTLDLSHPSALSDPLTALKAWDFSDLIALEGLNLSGNTLSELADEVFIDLDSLTELDVSGNSLETLPTVNGLTTLTYFDASGNNLDTLPTVNELTNLTHFDVSGNSLEFLPSIYQLTNLTHFDVSGNDLRGGLALASMSSLTKLTYVDLSDNKLGLLPTLSTLTKLTHFDVSNNMLTGAGLPSVASLRNLKNLDVSGNSLSRFPDLTGVTALTRLDLSENEIGEVPSDAFSGLSELETIRLDDNNLRSLPPGIFVGLESLSTLWLDKNPEEDSPNFILTLTPEETEDANAFVIKINEGAPAEVTAQASLEGGTSSSPTVTIAPGTRGNDP